MTGLDVARAAGVSQAAVSLVMTGKASGRISDDQRDRVLRIARELGYQPNPSARSLRLGRTQSVGLVVPNVANPFFASVLLGAERTARARQNAVMLLDTGGDPDWLSWMADVLSTRAVDGVIVYAADDMARSDVERLGLNVVLIEARADATASIGLDIAGGTREAMDHLIGLGHRRIAHLRANFDMETFRARARTYEAVMREHGFHTDPRWVRITTFDLASATAAARAALEVDPRPTAVLCDDDLVAAGVYKAAKELGLRIPGDLSVVGFDDIMLARMLEPELTTVAIPAERIGSEAMTMLLDVVQGHEPRATTLELELRVRGSTAEARR